MPMAGTEWHGAVANGLDLLADDEAPQWAPLQPSSECFTTMLFYGGLC